MSLKDTKIEYRIDSLSKKKIEKAAIYCNKKPSDFAREAALDLADKVVGQHENINLTENDLGFFYKTLENPPVLNDKLKEALIKHSKLVRSGGFGSFDDDI